MLELTREGAGASCKQAIVRSTETQRSTHNQRAIEVASTRVESEVVTTKANA